MTEIMTTTTKIQWFWVEYTDPEGKILGLIVPAIDAVAARVCARYYLIARLASHGSADPEGEAGQYSFKYVGEFQTCLYEKTPT